jgi:hypothetical protein
MRRPHLNKTIYYVFCKRVILKRENSISKQPKCEVVPLKPCLPFPPLKPSPGPALHCPARRRFGPSMAQIEYALGAMEHPSDMAWDRPEHRPE